MTAPAIAAEIAAAPAACERRLGRGATEAVVALAAVATTLCFMRFGASADAFVGSFFAGVVVYLAAFDLRHRVIPNRVVLPAVAIVLVAQLVLSPGQMPESLGAAAGAAGFFLVTLVAYPPGLGMGDVKLALLLGAALGMDVVAAILVGTLTAAVFGGMLMLHDGAEARKRAIAFGPFLAFGGLVALLLG